MEWVLFACLASHQYCNVMIRAAGPMTKQECIEAKAEFTEEHPMYRDHSFCAREDVAENLIGTEIKAFRKKGIST